MKISCKICGIVDKPHKCPYVKRNDANRADKKIYKDKRWKKIRSEILSDYNYICLFSLYVNGEIEIANRVHHIEEVLERKDLAYDYYNLIPLENNNHEYIHKLYKLNKTKVQKLLSKMILDYQNKDMTLGKYKKDFKDISPPIA